MHRLQCRLHCFSGSLVAIEIRISGRTKAFWVNGPDVTLLSRARAAGTRLCRVRIPTPGPPRTVPLPPRLAGLLDTPRSPLGHRCAQWDEKQWFPGTMARNVSDAKDAIVAVATERGIVNLRWHNLLFYLADPLRFLPSGVSRLPNCRNSGRPLAARRIAPGSLPIVP